MQAEVASLVCSKIAAEIQVGRIFGENPAAEIEPLIHQLLEAPATTTLDSLALVAIVRTILAGDFLRPDIDTETKQTLMIVFRLLSNAVAQLETETGFSAEGFTGDASVETLN